ncbi:SURF1 family cytochrome oxidase biogenesis protein [Phenylobacterium sp.]|uniref:SURF1 family protein n=1 Tax=Phenylobacterium sp. TaxID=1871053 RepID=UPI0025FA4BAF|nr:SURF1 family cytochrome oxidase biogenesis protein [Phenylobacterium sp.]
MTTEPTRARGRFPIGLTIATAIAFALLIGLGTWQVQRLHWKQGLLARIAALQAAPAQPLGAVLDRVAAGGDADYTRAKAVCPGLAKAPAVQFYTLRDGQAGVRLISACRTASAKYRSVLVDRGFLPDTVAARPAVNAADTTPLEIVGVLHRPDRGNAFTPPDSPRLWYRRNPVTMAAALQAPDPAPLFLMAETATNPEFKALIPVPIPMDIPNNHLEYAITWYGLALALLGVYAAMLLRWRKS